MKCWHKSVTKFGYEINEDFAISNGKHKYIAISDGAGGGGVYAERWAKFLCEKLPHKAISEFNALDSWVDDIWEEFYNQHEEMAKTEGGMFLQKFYEEGSFATLAAMWIEGDKVHWISYGDSVVFVYNKTNKTLFSSITNLSEFNNPPFLISTSNPLNESGFKSGTLEIHDDDIMFCTSDALAHYILMMYQLDNMHIYKRDIIEAVESKTKNSNYIITAKEYIKNTNFNQILNEIIQSSRRINTFRKAMQTLSKNNLIAFDDYSISIMQI